MRNFWIFLFATVPVFGVGLFVWAALRGSAWLPENISTNGAEIDHLFYVILAITGVVFVITEVLLVYALINAKPNADGKAVYTHGHHGLEVGWTIVTALILLFIAIYQIPGWANAKFRYNIPDQPPLALVMGSQFLWQIRYPIWDEQAGAMRQFDKNWTRNPNLNETFELRNELHVPVGEEVLISLTTRDVIHSFWLPNVRIKQDALPGHMIPVWFDTNKAGTYELVCAELCGWGHYRMRGKLVVHEKEDFNSWVKAETAKLAGNGEAAPQAEDNEE